MKLKHLVPATVLTTMSTVMAPLSLTSCSNNGIIGRSFDLTKAYYPQFQKYPDADLSRHEAHDIYREEILKRPETFVEDYFWSKSWRGTSFDQYAFWEKLILHKDKNSNANVVKPKWIYGPAHNLYESDHEVISNLEITMQKATYIGSEWIYPCLSFTLEFDSDISAVVLEQYYDLDIVSGYLNGTASGKITFYNVPFQICLRKLESEVEGGDIIKFNVITFEPHMEWMLGSQAYSPERCEYWKINTQVTSTVSGEIKFESGLVKRISDDWTFSMEANPDKPGWEYDGISLSETIVTGFTSSYFLNNVKMRLEGNNE